MADTDTNDIPKPTLTAYEFVIRGPDLGPILAQGELISPSSLAMVVAGLRMLWDESSFKEPEVELNTKNSRTIATKTVLIMVRVKGSMI